LWRGRRGGRGDLVINNTLKFVLELVIIYLYNLVSIKRVALKIKLFIRGNNMDLFTTEAMINLATELTKLVVKGTATAVTTKVATIKNEKNVENIRKIYDEIVNELIQERDEAVRIAQAYKSELSRVVISDEDIQHLHNTISRLLEILKEISFISNGNTNESGGLEVFEPLKELINIDTLKTMQLLGFNYKSAIGEPLTILCANAISSLAKNSQNTSNIRSNSKR